MPKSNFEDPQAFRNQLAIYSSYSRDTENFLQNLYAKAIRKLSCDEHPFALGYASDLEAAKLAIYPRHYHHLLQSTHLKIPLSCTDAHWLNHVDIPIMSPTSLGVSSITMSLVFGVLLDVFKEEFRNLSVTSLVSADVQTQIAIHTALFASCVIIYPLFYAAAATRGRYKPSFTNVTDFSWKTTCWEGVKLFIVLEGALAGLDFFAAPYTNAAVATGFATALSEVFEHWPSLTEWTPTTNLESLTRILSNLLTFGPLITLLNKLPDLLPAGILTYMPFITPITIFLVLNTWGRLVYHAFERLKDIYFYTIPNLNQASDMAPTLARSPEARASDTQPLLGAEEKSAPASHAATPGGYLDEPPRTPPSRRQTPPPPQASPSGRNYHPTQRPLLMQGIREEDTESIA